MGLKSILTNKITLKAILYTLMIFVIYRIGAQIITPGVSFSVSNSYAGSALDGLNAVFQLFGGGGLTTGSILMLGVAPYVTASIIIQLLETDLVPAMQEWKRQGVDGERKRSTWTKRLALIVGFIQAIGYFLIFSNYFIVLESTSILALLYMSVIVTAGVAIMMWFADRITEFGIGNGISVLIMANIIVSLPNTISLFIEGVETNQDIVQLVLILIIQLLIIISVVYYSLAKRRVNINYVRSSKGKLNEQSYIPIKLNPAGVIPIIFVGPLLALPSFIITIKEYMVGDNGTGWIENTVDTLFNYNSGSHWYIALIIYFVLIVLFSVFYSYIQMNPESMTENLERQGAYVVGVRPGEDTEVYLGKVINKTSIYGGLVLAIIAIVPIILTHVFSMPNARLSLLGTGIIITVNVIIQAYEALLNKVETKKYRKLFGGEK